MVEKERKDIFSLQHGELLEALLDVLETVPADEHEAHMEKISPDAALRREALALWKAEGDADRYLTQLSEDLSLSGPLTLDLSGKRVGAYRLLRQVGRGGMGVVYEADRVDGAFQQRVALKLLGVALAGTDGRKRFLIERQILAGLEHPAIARIVDGGVTEDGTPWFAMEYVDGVAIDQYCDHHRLNIIERLELFLQVCDAVDHAHGRLVVHRDLKPANVLVTTRHKHSPKAHGEGGIFAFSRPSDGTRSRAERQVKLLDFGIAKLLDKQSADGVHATGAETRLMTPEYASPEQLQGGVITTASDIYQLGVLLYELLTGERPYDLKSLGATDRERIICEQVPIRPSMVLSKALRSPNTDKLILDEISFLRSSTPRRLRRQLHGDIELIVLQALHKDSGRRYSSADRLAQDIRRHLHGFPVAAHPDHWMYRSRKFLRRHVVAAVVTGAALVLTILATTFYTIGIQSERHLAEMERDRAHAAMSKAEQMSQFMTGLFRSADPRDGRSSDITARELLDQGVQQVDRDLAFQPQIQSDMLQVLGRTYMELGVYDSTELLLTRALRLRQRVLGPDHPQVARTLGDIGLLRIHQGKYVEAQSELLKAIRILERSTTDTTSDLATILQTLGRTYRERGHYGESRAAFERALKLQASISGEDSAEVASIMDSLGMLLVNIGAPEQAEILYERSLQIHERSFTEDPIAVGQTLNELANVRLYLGKLDGIEVMFRRSLAILEKAYGPDHAWVGRSLNNLGNLLIELDQPERAVDILERALVIQSKALGPSHPEIAYPLASLGDAYMKSGNSTKSLFYYRRSVAIREKNIGSRQFDPLLAHGVVRMAGLEAGAGNIAPANRGMERAIQIWEQAPAQINPQLVPTALELGRWLVDQNRCSEALIMLTRVAQIQYEPKVAVSSIELQKLQDRCAT